MAASPFSFLYIDYILGAADLGESSQACYTD